MFNKFVRTFFLFAVENDITTVQSLQFDFCILEATTNNFSDYNKIGEGGFGDVYKVELYKCDWLCSLL